MTSSAILQDSLGVMQPVFKLALILSLRLHKLVVIVCWVESLNLKLRSSFLSRLSKLEHTFWHNSCSMVNSSNLGPQIMLLSSKEEWVCDDLSLEVSSEENFNLPGSSHVAGLEVWKTLPV